MQANHTPGPWQQHDSDYCPQEIWGSLDGPLDDGQIRGVLVCTVEDNDQLHSNARLIAAAPDMREALQVLCNLGDASIAADIRKALRPHEVASFDEAILKGRAAIAKTE